MKWHIDITLIPDSEIPIYFLWEKAYRQFHLALVDNLIDDKSNVGISFPEYRQDKPHPLGSKLRMLAQTKADLEKLDLEKHFNRLTDYLHWTGIKEISHDKITGYAFFKRLHEKGNNERLARRRSKRLKIGQDEALAYFNDEINRKLSDKTQTDSPFIYLNSQSRKQRFPLFIVMEKTDQKPDKAEFSSYGLSAVNSVPIF